MSPVPVLTIATDESALRSRAAKEYVSEAPGSVSPETPPYSPLTPVLASNSISGLNGALHPQNGPSADQPQLRPEPEPEPKPEPEPELEPQQRQYQPRQIRPLLPFSESDNPDAIALRSALSILHIQRQNALRDLKTLERQKKIAKADPEAFAADLVAGRVKTVRRSDGLGIIAPQPRKQEDHAPTNEEKIDQDDTAVAMNYNEEEQHENQQPPSPADSQRRSKFDDMPGPQNIIRTPPINWAKYHIVGEPLDRLHEEQTTRPTSGQPRRDGDESSPLGLGPKHVIAAPYSPWTDKLSSSEGQASRRRNVLKK